jgi:predicted transcriptional regulator
MKKEKPIKNETTDPDTMMSLRVPRSIHAELARVAYEDERTIAATVRLAIRDYLDRRKK